MPIPMDLLTTDNISNQGEECLTDYNLCKLCNTKVGLTKYEFFIHLMKKDHQINSYDNRITEFNDYADFCIIINGKIC